MPRVVDEDSKNIGDPINSRRINNKLELLDKKMDSLYKDIYISRIDDRQNLDDIINGLDSALDRLQNTDMTVSGMSELMRRIDKKQNSATNQLMDSVSDLFTDQSLVGILAANDSIHKYIASENYTYDLICKYLPKLKLALEIKRDNVLCADNFSKQFVNPQSNKSAKAEAQKFSINQKKLERKYEFSDFLDRTYMNVSKYGEDFIYIVPYNVAFNRIIKRSNQRTLTGNIYAGNLNVIGESNGYNISRPVEVVSENYTLSREFAEYLDLIKSEDPTTVDSFIKTNSNDGFGVNLYFNDSSVIQSPIHEYTILNETSQINKFKSMSSLYESVYYEESDLEKKYQKVKDDNDGLTNASKKGMYSDGLILPSELMRDPEKIDKNFTGAVVERIPRENIIPVYMGDICFGYYHLEFGKDPSACGYCGGHHNGMPGLSNGNLYARETDERQEELMLRFISAKISSAIDTHFINSNKDLKEEIYAILHYNEQFDIQKTNNIGVTFIPADDIVHCFFEQDEYTHRGISDLKDSIVPAMLYILLYLTDIIGKITRSTDKRIYYVKQNVEQNIARTMMNVVKQIKKGSRKALLSV